MAMTPQDQHAMVSKARRLLAELDDEEQAAVATLAQESAGQLSKEKQARLVELGLVERRLHGLDLTDLGEMVRAALTARASRRA